MNAVLISVGTEILLGDILNTNSRFLSQELASIGIGVYRHVTVGDNEERLMDAILEGLKNADIIITTGGLGPTNDDITKEVCAKALGKELVLDERSFEIIKQYFKDNDKAMKNGNEKQAYFTKDSIILDNPYGTAPAAIMPAPNNKYIIVLPGPPKEMEPLYNEKVRPFLEKLSGKTIKSKIMRFTGIGEWEMSKKVEDFSTKLTNPTVAPYAKEGECILRVTSFAKDEKEADELMEPIISEIKSRMSDNFYGFGEETIEEIVPSLLIDKKLTIATAESLTGGMIASTLIDSDKGISSSFLEGYITYSNESKVKLLGVKEDTLKNFGAVSHECAKEMLDGLKNKTNADCTIVTTGIAGPTGGTEEKPVGLVYIGVSYKDKFEIYKETFRGNRNRIRKRTTRFALDKLRRMIVE